MERLRQGIVAVIVNAEGDILMCERSDYPGSWQYPQGGIEPGESPEDAFYRELREEIGNGRCRIVKRAGKTTRYLWDTPGPHAVGQEHHWFLAEFEPGELPDLTQSDGCFCAWRWEKPGNAAELIFEGKRKAFREGLVNLGIIT